MPFRVIREDITKVKTEAIVCPTDERFSHGGGSDQMIFEAAGNKLDEYLKDQEYLKAGEAIVSPSFEMTNCRFIIHVCGPRFSACNKDEALAKLKNTYEAIFDLLKKENIVSVALPLIGSGAFGFPKKEAMNVAISAITDHLLDNDTDITLLVYDRESFDISEKLFGEVDDYLKDHYRPVIERRTRKSVFGEKKICQEEPSFNKNCQMEPDYLEAMPMCAAEAIYPDIDDFVPDESFTECLVRMINEKGLNESDIWKGANLDRKTFNQIRNNKKANPKKETVLAICIGMKLNIQETEDLLEKAGYVLGTSKFDWVMRFFIEHGYYNIMDINIYLAREDLKLLGSVTR